MEPQQPVRLPVFNVPNVTIGRVVHVHIPTSLVGNNNHALIAPGTVVRVWDRLDSQQPDINVKVHLDGPTDEWLTSVPYKDVAIGLPYWEWPPLV